VRVCVHACVCACMCMCVWVCVYMCMFVCMGMWGGWVCELMLALPACVPLLDSRCQGSHARTAREQPCTHCTPAPFPAGQHICGLASQLPCRAPPGAPPCCKLHARLINAGTGAPNMMRPGCPPTHLPPWHTQVACALLRTHTARRVG